MNTKMRYILCCLMAASLLGVAHAQTNQVQPAKEAPPVPLDALFDEAALWDFKPDTFMDAYRNKTFRWTQQDVLARSIYPGLTLDGQRVWEAQVYFKDGGLDEIRLSIYNRGDAGEMNVNELKELLTRTGQFLNKWSGSAPGPSNEMRGPGNTKIYRRVWARPPTVVALEWAVDRDGTRAEFLRMRLGKTHLNAATATLIGPVASPAGAAKTLTATDLRARVKRLPEGDVYIEGVPMVDQGTKGYCAAAVSERLMRYFGKDFDQHQLAQMAGTDSAGGTSQTEMMAAFSRIARSFGLNYRQLLGMDDVKAVIKYIEEYNKEAKRSKQPEIEYGHIIEMAKIYEAMDPEVLKRARLNRKGDYTKFQSTVAEKIQAGLPIIWTCVVGFYPEEVIIPQGQRSGHARLIIGYNARTNELLYSDTWGKKHELKRMPMDIAWAMTDGLFTLLPQTTL